MPQFQPANTHFEGNGHSQGLGQEMRSEQRGYPQQNGYPQQGYNEQNDGAYGGQQQQMGQQQMGNSNHAQGASQQPTNGGVGQAAEADNRDTITKCNYNPSDYMRESEVTLLWRGT